MRARTTMRGWAGGAGAWAVAATVLVAGCRSPHVAEAPPPPARKTFLTIRDDEFHINGRPTYDGRYWNGNKIQGLLINSRMVQGIFDDRNPQTVSRWVYPDTGQWDPDRNTAEFVSAMEEWRRHGLLAFTLNLQGGSPQGYSNEQPWHNSAFETDGSLRPDYLRRLRKVLDRADELGMVVILGYFYFGQDERLRDEFAVLRATDNATQWLLDHRYRNVLVEINNECNIRYDHAILQPPRVHELIRRVQDYSAGPGQLRVGTSYGGGTLPTTNVLRVADFILLHGNGVQEPQRIAEMVRTTRSTLGFRPMPILFNEDDHFDFEKPINNFTAALGEYASWGYFDPGQSNYKDGYQAPPVNWRINTERKRDFFNLVREITGGVEADRKLPPVRRVTYHGWPDAFVLSNAKVEAVVVPQIGRIMQFRFIGDDGPFWENPALFGDVPVPRPDTEVWKNYGGDKAWPAPQADWSMVTPRAWPPPHSFDSAPATARIEGDALILSSPVDLHYGIQAERRIELMRDEPRLIVTTTFTKILGPPQRVSVWVVTQLKHPDLVAARLPFPSRSERGYVDQSEESPLELKRDAQFLSLKRGTAKSHKIGLDVDSLLWLGDRWVLQIDSPRVPGVEYPDNGSSAEIYTNPDPLAYVELEMLGPMHILKEGNRVQRTSTYTLMRRRHADAETEAREIFQLRKAPTPAAAAAP